MWQENYINWKDTQIASFSYMVLIHERENNRQPAILNSRTPNASINACTSSCNVSNEGPARPGVSPLYPLSNEGSARPRVSPRYPVKRSARPGVSPLYPMRGLQDLESALCCQNPNRTR